MGIGFLFWDDESILELGSGSEYIKNYALSTLNGHNV
jgi:hypothetical protein